MRNRFSGLCRRATLIGFPALVACAAAEGVADAADYLARIGVR